MSICIQLHFVFTTNMKMQKIFTPPHTSPLDPFPKPWIEPCTAETTAPLLPFYTFTWPPPPTPPSKDPPKDPYITMTNIVLSEKIKRE